MNNFFVEKLEVGYPVFVNQDSQDTTTIDEGVYYKDNLIITVNNQGVIIKLENITTGSTYKFKECSNKIFGGDTYIGRFSLKRKHSFFNNTAYQLPDRTLINYSSIPNVAYPTYFFNTQDNDRNDFYINFIDNLGAPLDLSSITKKVKSLGVSYDNLLNTVKDYLLNPYFYLKAPNFYLDCTSSNEVNLFNFNAAKGIIYTYYYGIPYFLVESDINLDLRDSDRKEEEFYPKQSNLSTWLQDDYLKISTENEYAYDLSYSRQPTSNLDSVSDPLFKGNPKHQVDKHQRVVYSPENIELESGILNDRYLIQKPLDFYDFSLDDGKIVGIESLEGNTILVRFENNIALHNSQYQLTTDKGLVNLTAGRLFSNKPQRLTSSDLGYTGSTEDAFLSTPFGHIIVDPKRGQVFNLLPKASGLEVLSMAQKRNWFKENLPFHILKTISGISFNTNGVGIRLGFDNRFSTLYVTKLDYLPKVPVDYRKGIFYLKNSNRKLSLKDPNYFVNKSWTASYNFLKKEWVSFHSFTPNLYFNYPDHFDTLYINKKTSIWKHNISNKSYLTYYGVKFPFVVDIRKSNSLQSEIIKEVAIHASFLKYQNKTDFKVVTNRSFDNAIVYNNEQNSGLLQLNTDTNNLLLNQQYPILDSDKSRILVSIKENIHKFNQFKNKGKRNRNHWKALDNNIYKKLRKEEIDYLDNTTKNSYIRNNINNVRLYSFEDTMKVILKGIRLDGRISRR